MKLIFNKTPSMLNCENKFNKPIEDILRIMFVDENKSHAQIASELGISYPTLITWLKLAGIYSRKLIL